MRLKNIFENDDGKEQIIDQVHDLFQVYGPVDVDDDLTVNIKRGAKIRSGKSIKQLPFKFGHVTGELDMANTGLETLEGMPTEANTVSVTGNPIQSLKGCEGSTYEFFWAGYTDIKDLEYCPVSRHYYFSHCRNLASLKGLHTKKLTYLYSKGCPNLRDITPLLEKRQNRRRKISNITLGYNANLPLVGLTVLYGYPDYFPIDLSGVPKEIKGILEDYRGKGPTRAIDLGTRLVELGYKSNARLR